MGLNFLGEIPLHPRIRELSDSGKPITISEPNSPQAAAYFDIAKQIIKNIEDPDFAKSQEGPKIVVE
jgi:ATP-binding protein involved in chromosome partitioning